MRVFVPGASGVQWAREMWARAADGELLAADLLGQLEQRGGLQYMRSVRDCALQQLLESDYLDSWVEALLRTRVGPAADRLLLAIRDRLPDAPQGDPDLVRQLQQVQPSASGDEGDADALVARLAQGRGPQDARLLRLLRETARPHLGTVADYALQLLDNERPATKKQKSGQQQSPRMPLGGCRGAGLVWVVWCLKWAFTVRRTMPGKMAGYVVPGTVRDWVETVLWDTNDDEQHVATESVTEGVAYILELFSTF